MELMRNFNFNFINQITLAIAVATIFLCPKICNANVIEGKLDGNDQRSTTYFRHEPYGPKTYAFGFEINDEKTSNRQFRDERRFANGSVEGSYGYVRPDGRLSITNFIADGKRGFVSETRLIDGNDRLALNGDWYEHFWKMHKENATTKSESIELNDESPNENEKMRMDHIDLEKDLLNPTLENILNGNLSSHLDDDDDEPAHELKTFENVIPNQFPIVPFELPQKLQDALKKKNDNQGDDDDGDELKSDQYEKKHMNDRADDDWISLLVNQTRRDFLGN